MKTFARWPLSSCAALSVGALFLAAPFSSMAQTDGAPKKAVRTAADLPGFSYKLSLPPSELVLADDTTFNAFMAKVDGSVRAMLLDYDITDKATLRDLLSEQMSHELLNGRTPKP